MEQQLIIKMVLDAWHTQVKRTSDLFNALTDEQMMKEVAPGRNRGIYLLGHLAAVHDRMLPLLGLGDPLQPRWYEVFVENPDKTITDLPSTQELRLYWKDVNAILAERFQQFGFEDWFQKHSAVSEEDFGKEPHRNKLNIIVNRTNHLANHLGQLVFLQDRKVEE